jgi:predicted porin
MLGYLRYFNGSSAKEQVYVYLSNEIDDKFSNLNTVAVDTFMSGSKDIDTYFSVKFNNKGKNYIRGYLIDIVSNKKSLQNKDSLSTGLRVLFEKEVYVR